MSRDKSDIDTESLSGPVVDRRTTIKLFAAAGIPLSAAGCLGDDGDDADDGADPGTDDDDSADSTSTPEDDEELGGRLRAGWEREEFAELDPATGTDSKITLMYGNIFSAPLRIDSELNLVGDLATDWSVEEDPFAIEIELRDDVLFHNGENLTAEDFRYTVERNMNVQAGAAADLEPLKPIDEGGVEVLDDYRFRLEFEQAYAPMMVRLTSAAGRAMMPVPESVVEERGSQFEIRPVGTGPFEVAEHEVGGPLVLDAFDDFYRTDENGNQLPYLDGVDMIPIAESATRLNAIQTGDVDMISHVPLENVSEAEGYSGVEVVTQPGSGYESAVPKLKLEAEHGGEDNEPLHELDFRRGLAKLISSQELVDRAYDGNAEPGVGPIAPAHAWAWRPNEEKDPTQNFDPEEGRRLVEEVGIDRELELAVRDGPRVRRAREIQRQWEDFSDGYLDVNLRVITPAQWGDHLEDAHWDFAIAGMGSSLDPDELIYNFFRFDHRFGEVEDGYDGVWNEGHYMDEQAHELIGNQRSELDRDQRAEYIQDAEDRIIETVARVFYSHEDDVYALRDNVEGFISWGNARYFWTTRLTE